MTIAFTRQQRASKPGQYSMCIGGSLDEAVFTGLAVHDTMKTIGNDFHHVITVGSGDLLMSIFRQTPLITSVLTQPLAIRIAKYFKLKNVADVWRTSLKWGIRLILEVNILTGQSWDPIEAM